MQCVYLELRWRFDRTFSCLRPPVDRRITKNTPPDLAITSGGRSHVTLCGSWLPHRGRDVTAGEPQTTLFVTVPTAWSSEVLHNSPLSCSPFWLLGRCSLSICNSQPSEHLCLLGRVPSELRVNNINQPIICLAPSPDSTIIASQMHPPIPLPPLSSPNLSDLSIVS